MSIFLKLTANSGVVLLSVANGIVLSAKRKPCRTCTFRIYKLLAVAAVLFIVSLSASRSPGRKVLLCLSILSEGLAALALFATGAWMSITVKSASPDIWSRRVSPIFFVAAAVVILYYIAVVPR
jgi:hypothetical protein